MKLSRRRTAALHDTANRATNLLEAIPRRSRELNQQPPGTPGREQELRRLTQLYDACVDIIYSRERRPITPERVACCRILHEEWQHEMRKQTDPEFVDWNALRKWHWANVSRLRQKQQQAAPTPRPAAQQGERTKEALRAWEEKQPFRLPTGKELLELYPDFKADYSRNRQARIDRLTQEQQPESLRSVRPGAPRLGEGKVTRNWQIDVMTIEEQQTR